MTGLRMLFYVILFVAIVWAVTRMAVILWPVDPTLAIIAVLFGLDKCIDVIWRFGGVKRTWGPSK